MRVVVGELHCTRVRSIPLFERDNKNIFFACVQRKKIAECCGVANAHRFQYFRHRWATDELIRCGHFDIADGVFGLCIEN